MMHHLAIFPRSHGQVELKIVVHHRRIADHRDACGIDKVILHLPGILQGLEHRDCLVFVDRQRQ